MTTTPQLDETIVEMLQREDAPRPLGNFRACGSTTCYRCGGLLVQDCDWGAGSRCVQCGDVIDPIILRNRAVGRGQWKRALPLSISTQMIPLNPLEG